VLHELHFFSYTEKGAFNRAKKISHFYYKNKKIAKIEKSTFEYKGRCALSNCFEILSNKNKFLMHRYLLNII